MATIEEALDSLRGSRERFRPMLENKDKILESMCDYAERAGRDQQVPPWSIISDITQHGSGVSNAIYQVYRRQPVTSETAASRD